MTRPDAFNATKRRLAKVRRGKGLRRINMKPVGKGML